VSVVKHRVTWGIEPALKEAVKKPGLERARGAFLVPSEVDRRSDERVISRGAGAQRAAGVRTIVVID